MGKKRRKNAIRPFFYASRNKNIAATIRILREIRCLLYAGFLDLGSDSIKIQQTRCIWGLFYLNKQT